MVFTVSRVKGSKGSEVTPVEFPWGNPIQLGKEVGDRMSEGEKTEIRSRKSEVTPVEHPGREPGSTG